MDVIAQFKDQQKKAWSSFVPTEIHTCQVAARLAQFAQVQPGARVLDAACGTGVVALAAARRGARVTGLDLTPELLVRARENAAIAGIEADWHEGDVEALPFKDGTFDVVVSQFGHMFAPRPDVATREMLRVLKPGGTIAFATWPPEFFTGRAFALMSRFMPAPPPGVSPPTQWGSAAVVRERLGGAVTDLVFDTGVMRWATLSVPHVRASMEQTVAPVMRIVQMLENEPAKLADFRRELDALVELYFDESENILRQDYLLTRAVKSR